MVNVLLVGKNDVFHIERCFHILSSHMVTKHKPYQMVPYYQIFLYLTLWAQIRVEILCNPRQRSLNARNLCSTTYIVFKEICTQSRRLPTLLTSSHISFALTPWEFPDITKQGHSETWTSSVSCAAIAKVTSGCPFAVLEWYNRYH